MYNKKFVLPTWELVGGESKTMTLTLKDDCGVLYDLPGATVIFTVTSFVNSDAAPVITKTGEGSAEIIQGETGDYCDCRLTLVPNDTKRLCGKFIYQATITDAFGNVSCPQGIMLISDNISQKGNDTFTILRTITRSQGKRLIEGLCESTDTKPDCFADESMCVETDTGAVCYSSGGEWKPFGGEA